MGNSNGVNGAETTADDIDIDEWIVVNSPGGRYIGKAHAPETLMGAGFKEAIVDAVNNGDCIKLEPALDFLAPLRPMQVGGKLAMQRDPIVVPVDFTVMDVPVYVKASSVYFLADLKGPDRKTYKELVQAGLLTALHARAAASGLELAGGPVPDGKGLVTRG